LIQGLDHIGVAVRDLDRAIETYKKILGLDVSHREILPERNIEIAFFEFGGVRLEILSPTSERSPVHGFIEKRGEGLHHLAFRTDDVEKAERALKEMSIGLAQGPADGAHGTRVLFLHPRDSHGVLIELVQKK